jgi:predicted RNase H-like HicB family nuclease
MISEYIQAALEHAKYEIIEDDLPFYAEIPELLGVWANGSNYEECRRNLIESIESWLVISFRKNIDIPDIDCVSLMPKIEEFA